MGKKVNFHVYGHGRLNGQLLIDKVTEMEDNLADRLRVDKKALLKFVETQYPGAEINPASLAVRIIPIKESETSNEVKANINKDSLLNKEALNLKEKKIKLEKNTTNNELERENMRHKIQMGQLDLELEMARKKNRQIKIDNLNEEYQNQPKNAVYYMKLVWIYLDKGWKKVLAIFIVWVIIASIYKYIVEIF